jgi:hypothetical protein
MGLDAQHKGHLSVLWPRTQHHYSAFSLKSLSPLNPFFPAMAKSYGGRRIFRIWPACGDQIVGLGTSNNSST